jgi:hypothetical protein
MPTSVPQFSAQTACNTPRVAVTSPRLHGTASGTILSGGTLEVASGGVH